MKARVKRLILFDIDGTLLSAGRSGHFALEQATREILQRPLGLKGINLAGNTDRNVLHEICHRDSIPIPDEETISRFIDRYAEILEASIADKGALMPGVTELLTDLKQRETVEIGLVTGNFEEGAWIKLRRFGLDQFFSFGGFGGEHPLRSELVRLARQRAEERRGHPYSPEEVIMIGDTVADVAACRPWNIRCLALETGGQDARMLSEAGAAWVMKDFADTAEVLERLLG